MQCRLIISLLGLLMMGPLSRAQDTFEISVRNRAANVVHVWQMQEGKLMVIRRSEPAEVILLDQGFQEIHRTEIEGNAVPFSIRKRLGGFLGVRELPKHYILHFEFTENRPYVELIKLDKETFEMQRQKYFFVPRGYRLLENVVLANEFLSVAVDPQKGKLRILRTFGGEDTWSYTYDMDSRTLRQFNPHYYMNREGELYLTYTKRGPNWRNRVIGHFITDRKRPGASEHTIHYSGNLGRFRIRDNHLYSLGISRDSMSFRADAVMIDVYDFETMKPVASLSSDAIDSKWSIKPEVIFEGKFIGVMRNPSDTIKDEKKIMRYLGRGFPRLTVQEEDDHMELTIGTYIDNHSTRWKWPTPSLLYYRVKLDKTNFQSLGNSFSYTPTDDLTRFIAENRLDGNYHWRTYELFFRDGDWYFGYQPRGEKKYVFKKFSPTD